MNNKKGRQAVKQHIVLTFLSMIRLKDASETEKDKKVAIPTDYENIDGDETRTTNESALRYLLQKYKGDKIARIFIFASNAVRDNEKAFYSKEYNKKMTHLDYFRERMREFIPNIDECMPESAIFPYDENGTINDALRSVTKMSQWIESFKKEYENDEVILHVDLTGGMRSVNMMMLDVVRLMEYNGVNKGCLLYSNYDMAKKKGKVETLDSIYDLFGLISGAEEFIRFGSTKAFKDFYGKEHRLVSPQLRCLLDAMDSFAEEIKLCHYGQLEEAIINLHDAVHDYDVKNSDNVEELLMGSLIDRIRQEYHNLIVDRKLDDIKVIKWCLKNGYMQQAMTIYTERIPEYMGENNFIGLDEDKWRKLKKIIKKDKMKRNIWFYLLNECDKVCDKLAEKIYINEKAKNVVTDEFDKRENTITSVIDKFSLSVKNDFVVNALKKDKDFDFDLWLKDKMQQLQENNMKISDEDITTLKSQNDLFEKMKNDPSVLVDLDSAELQPLSKLINVLKENLLECDKGFKRLKTISLYINNATIDEIKEIFPIPSSSIELEYKYPLAMKEYYMIKYNIFRPNIETDKFLSIMDKYIRIKDERNHSNHAKKVISGFTSAEELKTFILDSLDEVEKVAASVKTE